MLNLPEIVNSWLDFLILSFGFRVFSIVYFC